MTGNSTDLFVGQSFLFIMNLIITPRKPDKADWLFLIVTARHVHQFGNDGQKKLFARMLYDGAEQLKTVDPDNHNARVIDYINVNFRIWCKPSLDSLDSFIHYEQDPLSVDPPALR